MQGAPGEEFCNTVDFSGYSEFSYLFVGLL